MKSLDLENEKIGKLLKKFAIPCIISMIVASLYNIVDQIFIGWSSAGAFGNAATNIVYPFTVIALAFSLLVGDGMASLFSILTGSSDTKKASKSIGNGLVLLLIVSLVITCSGLLFSDKILSLFGANKNEIECYNFAKDYFQIICYGLPFYIIGQGINSSIRSDGSPKYAMIATITGAITNIILDPIFIFVFKMEVKGAAIATIIGQIFTFIVSILYLKKSKLFKINKDSLKPDIKIMKKILSLGVASLITQLAIVIVIAVANNVISKYGYQTMASTNNPYGVVIPIAVIGICMKVFGIIISIVIGVALGGQPIIGYNMGALKTDRVKQTIKYILIINLIVGIIAFILFEFFPTYIINIFGNNNSIEYMEYARLCLKIYLGGIILTCLIKTSSILLQAMGSSLKSTILASIRDVIFFVPSLIIISSITHNIVLMLWSAVIADILSFIVGIFLLKSEIKKLDSLNKDFQDDTSIKNNNSILKKKIVITIAREYGSGGHYVGKLLAEKLGINFYDKEIINIIAKKLGYDKNYVLENEEKIERPNLYYFNNNKLFTETSKTIVDIAKKESCVIVGRCSDYILKDMKNVIKIYLYSNNDAKINRVIKYYNVDKENALKEINKINKQRAKYYNYFTGRNWDSFTNYDFIFNVDNLGVDKTADIIRDIVFKVDNK